MAGALEGGLELVEVVTVTRAGGVLTLERKMASHVQKRVDGGRGSLER
jgi:hypothetical protein